MADPILKKNYTGTFAGGQGPIHGMKFTNEKENSGEFGGEGDDLKTVDQGGHDSKPSGTDGMFDLHSKSYAGPENMQPINKGVVNPSEVHSSAGIKD